MNLLPLSLLFIAIFAFLSMIKTYEYKETLLGDRLFSSVSKNNQERIAESLTKAANQAHYSLNRSTPKSRQTANKTHFLLLRPLVEKADEDPDPEKVRCAKLLLKRLMLHLYGELPFFKEAFPSEKALDTFIEELMEGSKPFIKRGRMKRPQDWGNVVFKDKVQQTAFYKMLKGTMAENQKKKESSEEYFSLTQFIRFQKSSIFACPYAAKPEILAILFEDPAVVEAILHQRKEIQKTIEKTSDVEKQKVRSSLNEEFKTQFQSKLTKEVHRSQIDFNITGADGGH